MKLRLFAVVLAFILLIFGTTTFSAHTYQSTGSTEIPSGAAIHELLTEMLPAFKDFYGYDLVVDLNRAGLTLPAFATKLHNYLIFLYEAGILHERDFETYGDDWLFNFLDGIVIEMSESSASAWGNVSLKGLVLNDIYVRALGLNFLGGFFSHRYIEHLVENLCIAAYFDFLMRDASIEAVLPFGAAVRAFFERGETYGLIAVIGQGNVTALARMEPAVRIDFLAGLLVDRMAANLYDVIAYYQDFIVIPSPGVMVPVAISGDLSEQWRRLTFYEDIVFEVTTDIGDAYLGIFIYNTGNEDFIITMQTYDAEGSWYIISNILMPAGDSMTETLQPHEDLGDFIRITIYSQDGGAISGELEIEKQ
jgi:hypothetical protein